jgi:hypothetical protein
LVISFKFFQYAGQARSNAASRVRSVAAQIFQDLHDVFEKKRNKLERERKWPSNRDAQRRHVFDQDLFHRTFDRTLVPIFLDMLGFDEGKKEYKRWSKILYENFQDDVPTGLFKNEALIRVCLTCSTF